MPSVSELNDRNAALIGAAIGRRERGRKHEGLLPPDFCAGVLKAAQAEAVKVHAALDRAEVELTRLRGELKAAEATVKAAYTPLPGPVKRVGDVLTGGTRLERGPSTAALRTSRALDLERAKVRPLRGRITVLEQLVAARYNELGELRKVARMADEGSVTLIRWLAAGWAGRLMVGPAVMGQLPPAARELYAQQAQQATPADAAGQPLPPEALDAAGHADMPPMRQRGESLADYSARTGRGKGGGR